MNRAAIADVLTRIVQRRRQRLQEAGGSLAAPFGPSPPLLLPEGNPFLASLGRHRGGAVIAEVKMGSPSLGSLQGRFDPEEQARAYAAAGAAALSVVVEPDFFHGSYELLARCRGVSGLPAIAKDFVVDELQLDWARQAGAAAVLLVAALYEPAELRGFAAAARRRGLVPLVEIHDDGELALLEGGGWELVGVNSRDLRTFDVDLERGVRLAARLPTGALRVAESGIARRGDVERLRAAGFDAFLIGESLLTAEDPSAALRELLGGGT